MLSWLLAPFHVFWERQHQPYKRPPGSSQPPPPLPTTHAHTCLCFTHPSCRMLCPQELGGLVAEGDKSAKEEFDEYLAAVAEDMRTIDYNV